MLFIGHFRFISFDKEPEYGSFSIIATAGSAEEAEEIFRRRLQTLEEEKAFPGFHEIYLDGLIELPPDLGDGLLVNQLRSPGDFDNSSLAMLPSPEKQTGKVYRNIPPVSNNAGEERYEPFITFREKPAAGQSLANTVKESGFEYHARQRQITGKSRMPTDSTGGFWHVRWPNGSISLAAAPSPEHALSLFDWLGPVCPEMIKPWQNPELLLDLQFDIVIGDWLAQCHPDSGWRRLMTELAPEIDYALQQLYDMDQSEFEAPQLSDSAQKILAEALSRHAEDSKKEYEMLAAVHRARCNDPYCLFCIDESLDPGAARDKAGLA